MSGVLIVDEIQAPVGKSAIKLAAPLVSSDGVNIFDPVTGNNELRFTNIQDQSIPIEKIILNDASIPYKKIAIALNEIKAPQIESLPLSKISISENEIPFDRIDIPYLAIAHDYLQEIPHGKLSKIPYEHIIVNNGEIPVGHIEELQFNHITIQDEEIPAVKLAPIPYSKLDLQDGEIEANTLAPIPYSKLDLQDGEIEVVKLEEIPFAKVNVANAEISLTKINIPDNSIPLSKFEITPDSIEVDLSEAALANNSISIDKINVYANSIPFTSIESVISEERTKTTNTVNAITNTVVSTTETYQEVLYPHATFMIGMPNIPVIYVNISSLGTGAASALASNYTHGLRFNGKLVSQCATSNTVHLTIVGGVERPDPKYYTAIVHNKSYSDYEELNTVLLNNNYHANWYFIHTYGDPQYTLRKLDFFDYNSYQASKMINAIPAHGAYVLIFRVGAGIIYEDFSPYGGENEKRSWLNYYNPIPIW